MRAHIAPPLDTISRTHRNIDAALEHQNAQIASLSERVSHLRLLENDSIRYSPRCSVGRRDGSCNEASESKHGDDQKENKCEVTPSVAASTATALNVEHSAQRLKNALAQTRKEPVLNEIVVNE